MSYVPQSVPCAGCGEPTPYEVGLEYGDAEPRGEGLSYGEHLRTPLGECYRRTHRDRACVTASRYAVGGRPFVPRPPKNPAARAPVGRA